MSGERVQIFADGREVWFDDKKFTFAKGEQQRRVIRYLHMLLQQGTRRVASVKMLEDLDMRSRRVRDVFKDHPSWGKLLDERDGMCGFCLSD